MIYKGTYLTSHEMQAVSSIDRQTAQPPHYIYMLNDEAQINLSGWLDNSTYRDVFECDGVYLYMNVWLSCDLLWLLL